MMTSPPTVDASLNGHASQVRTGPGKIPPAPVLPAPARRRRPMLLAAGVVLVVVGALGAYALAAHAAQRVAVIAMASNVAWGEQITAADLVEVDIATDPALQPMAWSDHGSVIGQRAGADLYAGGLLIGPDLMADEIPPPGSALVGIAVKQGHIPATDLTSGERVLLISTATDSTGAAPAVDREPIPATVFAVADNDAGGARTVDVLVDDGDASVVASWSAAGTAAIVLVPRR